MLLFPVASRFRYNVLTLKKNLFTNSLKTFCLLDWAQLSGVEVPLAGEITTKLCKATDQQPVQTSFTSSEKIRIQTNKNRIKYFPVIIYEVGIIIYYGKQISDHLDFDKFSWLNHKVPKQIRFYLIFMFCKIFIGISVKILI